MTGRILSPGETRRALEGIGHQPDRRLGQSFLVDGNIVRKSVRLADIQPLEDIVEIGPGLGTLTSALLDAGAIVHAIEYDPVLHRHLENTLAREAADHLHLLRGDAVSEPLAGFHPSQDGAFKIVANLPYAISTPWIDAVLSGPLPRRMVLMLQAETAGRFTAESGNKRFGAISIRLQSAFTPTGSHRVSSNCFHPRPEVESTLIRLDLKSEPILLAPDTINLIRALFRQRRKQIGSLLRPVRSDVAAPFLKALEANGLSVRTRPEGIPLGLWHRLDQLVRATAPT